MTEFTNYNQLFFLYNLSSTTKVKLPIPNINLFKADKNVTNFDNNLQY